MIQGFPKIYHVGSPEVRDNLFKGGVEITEKIDGSQIGFGLLSTGALLIRSKGAIIYNDTYIREADKLFKAAVEYIISIKEKLQPETSYYGECISTNKHNTLTYRSVPRNHVVLYGIQSKGVWCDDHEILTKEADKLGFDSVPLVFSGVVVNQKQLDEYLKQESFYGGTKLEGVVVKNYVQLAVSAYSSACFGKYVSEAFKEQNGANWSNKPSKVDDFYTSFTNEARWVKGIQHMRDDGKITDSPKDIGPLIEAILSDFEVEQKQYVMEQLYRLYIRQVKQFVVKGFPEYYKKHLMGQQTFTEVTDGTVNTSVLEDAVR